jgi:hypothetical protein
MGAKEIEAAGGGDWLTAAAFCGVLDRSRVMTCCEALLSNDLHSEG